MRWHPERCAETTCMQQCLEGNGLWITSVELECRSRLRKIGAPDQHRPALGIGGFLAKTAAKSKRPTANRSSPLTPEIDRF